MSVPVTVIVGPMRSGTSLVASVVHRLGWHAGVRMYAPMPPTWRLDYEEPELSERLVRRDWPDQVWWIEYLAMRAEWSHALGFGGRFLLKCPHLALCWPMVLNEVENPLVFRTYRDRADTDRSMAAHPAMKESDQEEIRVALRKIAPDSEIGYEWATEYPERFVRLVAGHLGVEDDAAIQGAVATVGQPNRYGVPVP